MTDNNKNSKDEPADLFLVNKLVIKDNKLAERRKGDWVEEAYIEYNKAELKKNNKNYLGLALNNKIFNIFFVILIAGLGILYARAAYLQVIKGEEYFQLAENNRIRLQYIQAPRGIIYDRQLIALVKNVPSFSLYLTPVDFPKDEEDRMKILDILKNNIDQDFSKQLEQVLEISTQRKEYFQPQVLVENLDYEQAILLKIKSTELPGISIEVTSQREYLKNEKHGENQYLYNSLSHLLGYVGKINDQEYEELSEQGYLFNDVAGKTGLEKYYEKILRGQYGKKQVEVDSVGNEKKILAQQDLVKGDNLILSIDLEVQKKLEQLLRDELLKVGVQKAVGIVENPQNGELLAMVTLPSYDNNLFSGGISQDDYQQLLEHEANPLFNRAISGEYPSGSTIKPLISSAALQENIISSTTSFLSTGGIRVGQWFFPDWRAGGHGLTNVKKAISDSVNTFFYIVGGGYQGFEGLGVYKIKDYGEKFGLAQKTGIDLPNEKDGFLPSPEWKMEAKNEQWYIGDTYHLAIGQGDLLLTPLQLSNYISFFANKGIIYKPHLLKETVDSQTGQVDEILPEVLNSNFIDSYNIEIVRQGMRQTVTSGSARMLNSLPVTVAGKTGTAQWGTDKIPHAWFTCFAPYEDSEIVLTILIEEGEEGSTVAVPVANQFLYWYFTSYKSNLSSSTN